MKEKLKITLLVASFSFICLWFIGIGLVYAVRKVIVVPALHNLDTPIHELRLQRSPMAGKELYLLGLQMTFPSRELRTGSAVPFFKEHKIEMVSVFFNDRSTNPGNILISAYPDNVSFRSSLTPPVGKLMSRFLCGSESTYALLKTIHESKVSLFSWWDLISDIRQTYVLILKSIMEPSWYYSGAVYDVETDNLSGYLAEGKYGSDRRISQLIFAKGGTLYEVIALDRAGRDFKDLLSTIRVVQPAEAQSILNKYQQGTFSHDLILLSRLTDTIRVGELEELVRLTEMRKQAGERTVKETRSLHEELNYLKKDEKL